MNPQDGNDLSIEAITSFALREAFSELVYDGDSSINDWELYTLMFEEKVPIAIAIGTMHPQQRQHYLIIAYPKYAAPYVKDWFEERYLLPPIAFQDVAH